MPKTAPTPAKLTRPRLHHAVARERLFAKLDKERAGRRAICIVGPPGAGKTTLVASWSDARGIKGIWYQIDAGDADLATFFYYLGEAARPFARKGQRPLPALTPEYLQDISGFGRRFFRDLFAQLPVEACVVLDNYQEVAPDKLFHQVIADAVPEVPELATLVVVSRRDPPACYARLIANENVAFLDWEDLRLTVEETRAILAARGVQAEHEAERLHSASGGWAAGITLMLEGRRRNSGVTTDPSLERDAVFDYFAAQIFAQVPESTQRFLMLTALLTQVPASLARDLTGNPDAHDILEDLYRRHLFTHRRLGAEPVYWYHALFRGYLATQGERLLGEVERRDHMRRAARLLQARGGVEDAFLLFQAAQDWDAIARLAERQAAALLEQGRGQTLREWILALPPERMREDGWLRYWLGMSLIPIDQPQSRTELEAAYRLFVASANRHGQALAAAAVLDTYYFEWSDFRPMARWVERLEPFIEENLFTDAPNRELKIYASMLVGIFYGAPRHRMLRSCIERVSEMLDENLDVNGKLSSATILLAYCNLSGDLPLGQSVVLRARPLLKSTMVTPLNELWWFLRLGHYHAMVGDLEAARAMLDRADEVADAHGIAGLRSAALLIKSYKLLVVCTANELEEAQRLVDETNASARQARPMDVFHVAHGKAQLAALRRDSQSLSTWARMACRAAQTEGMVYTEVLALMHLAHAVLDLGNLDEVASILSTTRELIAGTYLQYFEHEMNYIAAGMALRREPREKALRCIDSTVRNALRRNYHYPNLLRFSLTLSCVLAEALAANVEPHYVREVIRRYRLRPPSPALPHWPWPIRVQTLGGFDVQIDGTPLRFGKTPRKPLALLKAIIAFGGTEVAQSKLIDALWPGDEGDAGKVAFGVTMVRLRRLLRAHDVIQVAHERVSLNPDLCWVDARAFELLLKEADSARDPEERATSMRNALQLYKGRFLPADEDAAWTVHARLRLRGLFTNGIEDVGTLHEARGAWDQAIDCYRRGLEADDLIEGFYLGLMRCYRALGRPAEGIAVFRRLRQTLSVVLGVAPSSESEDAAQALRAAGERRPD